MPRIRIGPGRVPPVVKALLITNAAVFVVQVLVTGIWSVPVERIFGVSNAGLVDRLWLWQPFTYMFLHSTTELLHILSNMLMLWIFGSWLEERLGSRRFLFFYLAAGVVAGLAYATFAVFGHMLYVPAIGASGAVIGVLVHLAFLDPNRTILLFFVFPVRLKYLAAIIVGIDLLYFVGMQGGGGNVAHTAHLGGAAFGYLYYRYAGGFRRMFDRLERQAEQDRRRKDSETRAEVDRLLEKIHREGIASLSEKEKRFLKRSSKRFG